MASPNPDHVVPNGFGLVSTEVERGRLAAPFAARAGVRRLGDGRAELPYWLDNINATGALQGGLLALCAEEAVLDAQPDREIDSLGDPIPAGIPTHARRSPRRPSRVMSPGSTSSTKPASSVPSSSPRCAPGRDRRTTLGVLPARGRPLLTDPSNSPQPGCHVRSDGEVSSVAAERIGTGQTGAAYRLTIDTAGRPADVDRQGRGRRCGRPPTCPQRLSQRGRVLPRHRIDGRRRDPALLVRRDHRRLAGVHPAARRPVAAHAGCPSRGVHDRAGTPRRVEPRRAPRRPLERRVGLRPAVRGAPDSGRRGVRRIGGGSGDRHLRRAIRRGARRCRRRDAPCRSRRDDAVAPGPPSTRSPCCTATTASTTCCSTRTVPTWSPSTGRRSRSGRPHVISPTSSARASTVDDRRAAERELVAELPRGALRPRRVGLRRRPVLRRLPARPAAGPDDHHDGLRVRHRRPIR